jgi:hypothetical protein
LKVDGWLKLINENDNSDIVKTSTGIIASISADSVFIFEQGLSPTGKMTNGLSALISLKMRSEAQIKAALRRVLKLLPQNTICSSSG